MTKLGQILLTIWRITRLFLKGVSLLSYKCSYSIILSRIFFPPPRLLLLAVHLSMPPSSADVTTPAKSLPESTCSPFSTASVPPLPRDRSHRS